MSSQAKHAPRSTMARPSPSVGAEAPATRATTFRLTPANEQGLRLLNAETGQPLNKLVNEAVAGYIETRSAALEQELQQTLERLKAWRQRDPGFRKAIAAFVEGEATADDPAEGRVLDAGLRLDGPVSKRVRDATR